VHQVHSLVRQQQTNGDILCLTSTRYLG